MVETFLVAAALMGVVSFLEVKCVVEVEDSEMVDKGFGRRTVNRVMLAAGWVMMWEMGTVIEVGGSDMVD